VSRLVADGDAKQATHDALAKVHRAGEKLAKAVKAHKEADERLKHLHEVWIETKGTGPVEGYQEAVAATAAARDAENKALAELSEAMRELADATMRFAAEMLAGRS
jgi:hypothetical protein